MTSRESIELLGLTQHEAEVYNGLLWVERARVRELAELVPLPRQHIYLALNRLTRKGFVACDDRGVRCYSAVSPDIVFNEFIDRERELMVIRKKVVKDLTRRYAQRKSPERKSEIIETIRGGRSAVEEQIRRISNTRKELLALYHSDGPGTTNQMVDQLDDLELKLLGNGVTIRCVYKRSALDPTGSNHRVKAILDAGEQARVVDDLPMTLQIIDNETVVFDLRTVPEGGAGFFINDPLLVKLHRAAFNYYWEKGQPIENHLAESKV